VLGKAGVLLLLIAVLDSGSLRQREDGFLSESDDKYVAETGGEGLATGVTNVSNIERAGVSFDVGEDTDTAD
jgi:hypothetical protein